MLGKGGVWLQKEMAGLGSGWNEPGTSAGISHSGSVLLTLLAAEFHVCSCVVLMPSVRNCNSHENEREDIQLFFGLLTIFTDQNLVLNGSINVEVKPAKLFLTE